MKSDLPEYIMASIPHEAAFMKVYVLFSLPNICRGLRSAAWLRNLAFGADSQFCSPLNVACFLGSTLEQSASLSSQYSLTLMRSLLLVPFVLASAAAAADLLSFRLRLSLRKKSYYSPTTSREQSPPRFGIKSSLLFLWKTAF